MRTVSLGNLRTAGLLTLLVLVVLPAPAIAQVKYPPLPESVDVQIRYRIPSTREERVREFRILEANLKRLGFVRKRQPDDQHDILDPAAERFEGVIPSKNVLATLDDPRVRVIQFRRTDFKAPEDPDQLTPLRIRIRSGYLPAEQQRLHEQVVAQLARLGFREAIGYDHDGYRLVRGDLPFKHLFRLLKDLRSEPSGWFVTDTPLAELPAPLRDASPIRWVEVLPDAAVASFNVPPLPANRVKFTPEVRAILDDMAQAGKPLRAEVVMDRRLDGAELESLRLRLQTVYTRILPNSTVQQQEGSIATLDGMVGNVLTIFFPRAQDLEAFAAERGVVFIRLPRPAVETVAPVPGGKPATPADTLAATRVDALQSLGYKGAGTKVVVVAAEFPGLSNWLGARFLNKGFKTPVAYIDLTAELSKDLLPSPLPANAFTGGTLAARAVHLAAPHASLVLVRVDPAAFFQMHSVGRFARGDKGFTEAMQSRIAELSLLSEELKRRNAVVSEEYRQAFQNLSDEDGPRLRRERARAAFDRLFAEEQNLAATVSRATALQAALRAFSGCDVVVNTLVWEHGFPHDGLSDVSQMIDTSFASEALTGPRTRSATRLGTITRPLWVQAASPSVGSVWGGPFIDVNGNGLMEFAPPDATVPANEWNRELNFLASRAGDGAVTPTLSAGARVRLTVQWRETHDPTSYGGQNATFPLTLRVFQQLDPEGKVRASDELREVARSVGGPYPLRSEPTYGVYEQILEFTVPENGRYAIVVEGRPTFDPRLPALRRQLQIQPRLFAEFLGPPTPNRPVFSSYAPRNVGVGIPGDAKAAITVAGTTRPLDTTTTGLTGGGPGIELLRKPDLLADGTIALGGGNAGGSGVAAGFAGGVMAALIGSGAPASDIICATGLSRGGPVVVPEGWLRAVLIKKNVQAKP